jgi:hypothetical protein
MHERHPLAASSFWFLIAALGVLVLIAALLFLPSPTGYFFSHPVLLRSGFLVLAVMFGLLSACGSVLGYLADTIPGRRDGIAGTILFLTGIALLATAWMSRIP